MEASNMKTMREILLDIKSEAETTLEYRDYPIAGDPGERGYCKVVDSDYLIEKCNEALSAPPRACDVMSKEDLTKVVTNALRHSLAKIPEFTIDWAKSLFEVVAASAIECAYDTQLVIKKEEGSNASK